MLKLQSLDEEQAVWKDLAVLFREEGQGTELRHASS
jgi:hypothetical protein